jgi:hypothetical protein
LSCFFFSKIVLVGGFFIDVQIQVGGGGGGELGVCVV